MSFVLLCRLIKGEMNDNEGNEVTRNNLRSQVFSQMAHLE